MQSTTHAAPRRGHLSRHERQRRARAEAFSRRTSAGMSRRVPVKLEDDELELIERLVRREQITRHLTRALEQTDLGLAA